MLEGRLKHGNADAKGAKCGVGESPSIIHDSRRRGSVTLVHDHLRCKADMSVFDSVRVVQGMPSLYAAAYKAA